MQKKTTVWYTLGEGEKATGIPRTQLDHACRVKRLPYRRTEAGFRLLSHEVVEKLRKDGLKSFPRPYDPIASSIENEASSSGATRGTSLTAQRNVSSKSGASWKKCGLTAICDNRGRRTDKRRRSAALRPRRNDKLKLRNARRHSARDNRFAWRKHARLKPASKRRGKPRPAIAASNGKLPCWTMP